MVFWVIRLLWEEDAATAVEYGLLTALIALVMAGGAVVLGDGLNGLLGDSGTALDAQGNPTRVPPSGASY